MARPQVYVTRRLPSPGLELLREVVDVTVHPGEEAPSRGELLHNVQGKDGLVCLVTDTIDAAVMDAALTLRVISTYSVGYNHIDVAAATERGIYVTYTPGVLTEATADFTWALLLATARRVGEADRYVRGARWRVSWTPDLLLGAEVYGKTLGIIGIGRIGRAVAERARGFAMRILYHDTIRLSTEEESRLGAKFVDLSTLLREADFVTVHVPLLPETRHLIDADRLRQMKRTAYLVNTARGPVVDEYALADALRQGIIAGAGLDVYAQEPIPPDHPLLQLESVVLAPHIGSGTWTARSKMAEQAAQNLLAVLRGETPSALVNPDVQTRRPLAQVKLV